MNSLIKTEEYREVGGLILEELTYNIYSRQWRKELTRKTKMIMHNRHGDQLTIKIKFSG